MAAAVVAMAVAEASGGAKDVRAIPLYHSYPPDGKKMKGFMEECHGRNVVFMDFAIKREDCERIAGVAKNFMILDHHITNARGFADLRYACIDTEYAAVVLAEAWRIRSAILGDKASNVFEKCPGEHPLARFEPLKCFVGDRDTWAFKLPHSKDINAGLAARMERLSLDNAIRVIVDMSNTGAAAYIEELRLQGKYTAIANDYLVRGLARNAVVEMRTRLDEAGVRSAVRVAYINATMLGSEMADYLLNHDPRGHGDGADLVVYWWYNASARTKVGAGFVHGETGFSFRSKTLADGFVIDVSALAKSINGGGGHTKAAGAKAIPGPPSDVLEIVREHLKDYSMVFVKDESE